MKPITLFAKSCLGMLLLAAVISSCKKNESAEKPVSGFGSISYFAKASASGIRTAASPDSAIQGIKVNWGYATVWVEKISFTGQGNNLLDTTIMVEKQLNIFSEEALAGVVQLPIGSYKNVKVKLFCRKSPKSEYAFEFKGSFTNSSNFTDSIRVGSSFPFEANLAVSDVVINPSDNYKATFNFDLNKVLTGITVGDIERYARITTWNRTGDDKLYVIWKGGSQDEPFYDQVIANWQNVASVVITKEPNTAQ